MKTDRELLQEANAILEQSHRTGSFNREAEAKVNQLLRMVELVRAGNRPTDSTMHTVISRSKAQLFSESRLRITQRNIDPAALEFFGGRRNSSTQEPSRISIAGGRIDELPPVRHNGRSVGAITELRDMSSMLETRTYSGLAEGSGSAGGDLVPIGYIPRVIAALKRTEQILEAADWETAATANGEPFNLPNLSDTSVSAVTIAEAAAQTFANPTFGLVAFPDATTWTSQVVLATVQLSQDAQPQIANTLADAFRIRFARGFGASVVSTVLTAAAVGATTASPTAITQQDLLDLMGAVDAEYAMADGAGFCMNWSTLLYVLANVNTESTGGDALFHAKTDDRGHYLLFGKPVYICNSMDSIGSTKKPVLFGDYSRLVIRNVPSEAVIRRYDELFMASNFAKGFEMLFRADAAVVQAGGSGDNPIQVLQCHS